MIRSSSPKHSGTVHRHLRTQARPYLNPGELAELNIEVRLLTGKTSPN